MDNKIAEAIRLAVNESGQRKELARKLEQWFEALASGNEQINDPDQSANRRLDLLYDEATEK